MRAKTLQCHWVLSDTQQEPRHAPGHLRISLPRTRAHTHTENTQSRTTARHYRADKTKLAQLWCMHTYVHTQTRAHYSRIVVRQGVIHWKIGASIHVKRKHRQKGNDKVKHFVKLESDEDQIKCKTGGDNDWKDNRRAGRAAQNDREVVCVCVSTNVCITTSGTGSAERVWRPLVVTPSLSEPLRRQPDKWDTSCWPEDRERKQKWSS